MLKYFVFGLSIGLLLVSGVFALGSGMDLLPNDKIIDSPKDEVRIVPIVESKSFDVCIEKQKKGDNTIISKSEPMTMVQIAEVVSKKDLKNNKKDCFTVTKETTREKNKIIKEELKEIKKK